MKFLDRVKDAAAAAKERIDNEAQGAEAKGKGRGRILAGLVGDTARSAARNLQQNVRDKHDDVILKQHEARKNRVRSTPDELLATSFGAGVSVTLDRELHVEVLAAADLKNLMVSDVKAYCCLALGPPGACWRAKSKFVPEVITNLALRTRHPRWSESCKVPYSEEFGNDDGELELTVRVLSAHATRADTVLGEGRVCVSQEARGHRTLRLLGGGFASLCLRWDSARTETPFENTPFERALGFWSASSGSDLDTAEALSNILVACGESEADVVNELIMQAPLADVFGCGDASVGAVIHAVSQVLSRLRPLTRSRLVGALLERVHRLNAESHGHMASMHVREEGLVHDILMTAHGEELVETKRLIDTAGPDRDLRHIIFSGKMLRQARLREAVLEHFRTEAERLSHPQLHVLSDIDQTIWIGKFGAGGPKFPRGPIPGAMALYRALGGRITFLSARPPVWEGKTRGSLLDDMGIAEATVLPGTLQNVIRYVFQKEQACEAMGQQKENVFLQFTQLHPEAKFVFVGDSGEGDVGFARSFMACLGGAREDRAALIHDVVCAEGLRPVTPASEREELREQGVIVFDTYLGAALELYKLKVLTADGLRTMVQLASCEFYDLAPEDYKSPMIAEARRQEFEQDLHAVNAVLRRVGEKEAKRQILPKSSGSSRKEEASDACPEDPPKAVEA